MNNKYIISINWVILFLVSLSLIALVSAVDSYNYYFEDPVVPKQGNLEVKNNFIVDSFSGAAVYSYPLTVPPGTNGLQPEISLSYNSHSTGQKPGILGTGWSLSESYIQRETNYSFGNTSDDTFILMLQGTSYDLRYSANEDRYHTKVENFFFINKTLGGENEKGEYWIVKTKDGTLYRFGFFNSSELLSNTYNYTWRWSLDSITDTYSNSIFYNYTENPFPQDNGTAYLDSIRYNNDRTRNINFYYQPNNMQQLRFGYENGNLVSQSRMLKEIIINVSDEVVRKYVFKYKQLGTDQGNLSSVSNITEYGSDGVSSIHPVKFGYKSVGNAFGPANWSYLGCRVGYTSGCFVDSSGNDLGVRLADVNGDGLVDVVKANGETLVWLNNGTGWNEINWTHMGCESGMSGGCFLGAGGDIGTRLVDINGDGLTDVFRSHDGPLTIDNTYINNGTGWNNVQSDFPGCANGGSHLGCFVDGNGMDLGTRILDLNGDGLIDVVRARHIPSGVEINAWTYNGNVWSEINWTYPGCKVGYTDGCFAGPNGEDYGVRQADVNGDGLVDVIRSNGDTRVWLNNGTGWYEVNWTHGGCDPGLGGGCFSNGLDIGVRLVDLNGDGLVDVFKAYDGGSSGGLLGYMYLNNGTSWVHETNFFLGCQGGVSSEGCFVDYGGLDRGVRAVDLNGDGVVDVFKAKDTGSGVEKLAWINERPENYLLKNINLSLGGEISIGYQTSTSLDNNGNDTTGDLNFNIWLVHNITKNNHINGPHNLSSTTVYNFTDGLYNHTSNGFRGFNFAQEKISNKITNHWFHQGDILSGREFKTEVLDNEGNIYKITQKNWESTQQNSYHILKFTQESELTYDSNNSAIPKTSNKTYAYDSFGNNIYTHTKGNNDDVGDDYYEYMSYVNNSDLWIVNTIQNYTLIDSDNSTRLRQTNYSYDGLSYGSAPTKGSVTFKEELLFGEAGNNISFQYNSFGNVEYQTDSRGNKITYSYGNADPSNTFADSATDAKGFKTIYGYELGSGNMRNQTSSNHFFSNFTYDFLNIDKQTVLPLDNINFPTQEYSYTFQTVGDSKIIVKQRERNETSNTLDTYKFYDGFGKIIQSKTDASDDKQIVIDYYYDNFGRILRQSNPYLIVTTPNYTSANTSVPFTLYQYDPLGRVIKVFNPDDTVKNISFYLWNITLYDENSHRTGYELDSKGRISRVIEYNGSASYPTSYKYNAVGELILINDSLSNAFNFTYDSLGRKKKERDPDRGIWNYSYDTEGNLIKQYDNRNISLSFVYDSLNRKLNESSGNNWVKYIYDSDLNNTLSDVLTNISVVNYSYDNRLRKVKEEKNISNIKYNNSWTYDSADRVISQIMPNGRVINFTYNDQGLLSNISKVANISYNANNNPINISYSNNLVTQYDYNSSNLRLVEIKTSNKQNLDYQYDPVGNVMDINDAVHNISYTLTYDHLNRLNGTNIGGPFVVALSFIYDQIGNIRNVTGTEPVDYYYQDYRPHATSSVVFY